MYILVFLREKAYFWGINAINYKFVIMLVKIISHYLETNKRLVIPQLGAFIVKSPLESILFSELLKRDDGVLRALLIESGMSEIEAVGAIDRFVFEVRHALKNDAKYILDEFGIIFFNSAGVISFEYSNEIGSASNSIKVESTEVGNKKIITGDRVEVEIETGSGANVDLCAENKVDNSSDIDAVEPKVRDVALDSDVEKTTKGRVKSAKKRGSNGPVGARRKKKGDKFLVIAIIAIIIAISVIAFGYFIELSEEQQNRSFVETINSVINQ